MLIDSHCHLDQLNDPLAAAQEAEDGSVLTVAVTNLPSHYEIGIHHVRGMRFIKLALGLHPLAAKSHEKEIARFLTLAVNADFVGEIGLDFSRSGLSTRDLQVKSLRRILPHLCGRQRLITVHSREAEREVLTYLKEFRIGPVIFHWYSGSLPIVDEIVAEGHFFSINPAMVQTNRFSKLLSRIPKSRVLTETDAPHAKFGSRPLKPSDVSIVLDHLSREWRTERAEAESIVEKNFHELSPTPNCIRTGT